MSRRVMFYVQHLLGVGHLKRASLIVRALVEEGLDVAVALGGPEVPGVDFADCARILLPSVRAADETFKVLLDEDGRPIDDAWRDRRVERLLTEFRAFRPQVLLLEMFPFGRLQFRFELLPLLEAARTARPRPTIVSSVRDALVRRSAPDKAEKIVRLADRWFDCILVHGDPQLFGLEATFPQAAAIADRLVYTGYVVDSRGNGATATTGAASLAQSSEGRDEVIVSVGGGAVGLPLLQAAREARALTRHKDRIWRLITGPNLPDADYERLAWDPPDGVIVERWRDDLPRMLAGAALSISQGGYNTIMDILAAGVPAIVVPFAAGNETEQTFRARRLADKGVLTLLPAETLSPSRLAEAVDDTAAVAPSSITINTTGAQTTARLIAARIQRKARHGRQHDELGGS
ncbi:MAG: glycosyltransferase [Rhodospirillales bacterium]